MLTLLGSLVAAAWYVDDRVGNQIAAERVRIEARVSRMEDRWERRWRELGVLVREVNSRLDRLIEQRTARAAAPR